MSKSSIENKFIDYMGGYTSDHAIQKIEVTTSHATIKGATWNVQNKCRNIADEYRKRFANNPANVSETPEQYNERKKKQVAEINKLFDDTDFVLLQEADVLTDLSLGFKSQREARGWKVLEFSAKNHITDRDLVILYNPTKINPSLANGNPDIKGAVKVNNSSFKGQLVEFAHTTGIAVALCNLHLDYLLHSEQQAELDKIQQHYADNGILCIMGGATNHSSNVGLNGLMGDPNVVTNISDEVKPNGSKIASQPTTLHGIYPDPSGSSNMLQVQKKFDGFFVGAGFEDAKVKLSGDRFEVKNHTVQVIRDSKDRTYDIPAKTYWRNTTTPQINPSTKITTPSNQATPPKSVNNTKPANQPNNTGKPALPLAFRGFKGGKDTPNQKPHPSKRDMAKNKYLNISGMLTAISIIGAVALTGLAIYMQLSAIVCVGIALASYATPKFIGGMYAAYKAKRFWKLEEFAKSLGDIIGIGHGRNIDQQTNENINNYNITYNHVNKTVNGKKQKHWQTQVLNQKPQNQHKNDINI